MSNATPDKPIVRCSIKPAPLLIAATLLCGVNPVSAQTSGSASAGWTYELTPYLWGAAMKGDVQVGSLPKTSTDMSFADVLDILDFGLMGAFEARKGRWGLFVDAMYMKVSDSATASQTGPGPLGATLTATANVKMEQTMLAVAAMYRAVEGRTPLDVVGGLRYNKLDVSADIGASLFGPLGVGVAATVARSGDKDWVDPYIGLRIQHPIANRWTMVGYADIGGFGVGSEFTWQAVVGFNYEFSKTTAVKFGYRYLSIDYDKGGFLYDMKTDGLYFGVGIRF